MSEIPKRSSGEFWMPRFRLQIREDVVFPDEVAAQTDVEPVIEEIAQLEENPCAECPTILDLVRLLAARSAAEPEEMGQLEVRCRPDNINPEFYEVQGELADQLSQRMTNVRCQLLMWMIDRLKNDTR